MPGITERQIQKGSGLRTRSFLAHVLGTTPDFLGNLDMTTGSPGDHVPTTLQAVPVPSMLDLVLGTSAGGGNRDMTFVIRGLDQFDQSIEETIVYPQTGASDTKSLFTSRAFSRVFALTFLSASGFQAGDTLQIQQRVSANDGIGNPLRIAKAADVRGAVVLDVSANTATIKKSSQVAADPITQKLGSMSLLSANNPAIVLIRSTEE